MLWGNFTVCFDETYVWGSLTCGVYGGSVITMEQRGGTIGNPPAPSALECTGLNVKQHYILGIEYLYFEDLCVARNANNDICFKYTPCFCMLPLRGVWIPKKNTPFHILSPSLKHGLLWAIAPRVGWATCDA